jgi:hypothetical protein
MSWTLFALEALVARMEVAVVGIEGKLSRGRPAAMALPGRASTATYPCGG